MLRRDASPPLRRHGSCHAHTGPALADSNVKFVFTKASVYHAWVNFNVPGDAVTFRQRCDFHAWSNVRKITKLCAVQKSRFLLKGFDYTNVICVIMIHPSRLST